MSGKKYSKTVPSGDSKASGTAAPAGTVDVYTVADDGTRTYLGWVTDKNKLAFFSRAGDRLINPGKSTKYCKTGSTNNFLFGSSRTIKKYDLLLRPDVDKVAAEILIKWINDNDINDPKTFIFDYALFGPTPPSFETALNVHHAMHAFDIERKLSGQVIRNAIFDYINTRGHPEIPSAADFKFCMEKIDFDGGVLSCMMNQIMWRSVNKNIDPVAFEEIKAFCKETDRYESMKAIGEQVVVKKLAFRKGKAAKAGKVVEHGW